MDKNSQDYLPVITISRQTGSGGLLVANALKQKLGKKWKVWDREVLDEISKVAKVRKELIEPVDERFASFFEQLAREILGMHVLEASAYHRHLVKAILSIGHQGYSIIVGRGANFILPWAFRVRVIAAFDTRVERLVKYESMTKNEAGNKLKEWDRERKVFVRELFDRNIDNPWHYDLIINTDHTPIEVTTELILSSYQTKFA